MSEGNVEFKIFFGRDSVYYFRLYLATCHDFKSDSPLFIKERISGGEDRLTTSAIWQSFSEVAKNLSFIAQNGEYNPVRQH